MTEKRFTTKRKWFDEHGNRFVHVVLDNGEYWNDFMFQADADIVCHLLNQLNDENMELEHRNRELECHLKDKEQTIDALLNNEFVPLKESFEERLRNNPMPTMTLSDEHDV